MHPCIKAMPGHDRPNDHKSPLPHTYVKKHKLPKHFSWVGAVQARTPGLKAPGFKSST